MKTTLSKAMLTALTFTVVLYSCKKEDDSPQTNSTTGGTNSTSYTTGVFITNEGVFGSGNGSVCFFNRSSKSMSYDIFKKENGVPLGDVVQSMTIHNGNGYIVVNNSNKVAVVSPSSFKSKATITGLNLPRYFIGSSNSKGYVSQWGSGGLSGSVAVVDLNTNTVTKTIPTKPGAENMIIKDKMLYVTCRGGYGNDSTVTVISTDADTVVKSIIVGHNPNSIQEDKDGNIWVLCGGIEDWANPANSTKGSLVKLDANTGNVLMKVDFSTNSVHPTTLRISKNKDVMYYLYNGMVYNFPVTNSSFNTSALISKNFYGMTFDPQEGYILGTDAGNFSSDGWMFRYTINGAKVDSFKVGIAPSNFCFN